MVKHQRMSSFYCISNHKNFISKYLDNTFSDFAAIGETSSSEWFWKKNLHVLRNMVAGKIGSDVISLL